ncbi:beta strand repeat-containing protein [Myxococcus stipitatus]|uniref:beta strand repeat-containing protein n=1 Tax=Myxococcus stipitatus TaxID=83455 RepID=UPI0030CFB4E4
MKRSSWEPGLGLGFLWCALLVTACGGESLSPPPALTDTTQVANLGDAGPPINYAYDESRRLVAVYDGTGASAQYVYDKGGNLLEIKRLSAAQLGLFDFAPNEGPPGGEVTLTGSGFSTTPASNTVRFNGVAAVVTAASEQRLVVTVPAGATTGTVSVEVGGVTATSHEDFVVLAPVPAPIISGFSPAGGPVGTTVTITGSNFSLQNLYNRIFIGDIQADIVSSTATQLQAKVSSRGATGKVRVSTPSGRATSTQDFMVVPVDQVPGGTDTLSQAEVGGAPVNVSLGSSTNKAALSFAVQQGEQVTIVVSSVVLGGASSGTLRVYDGLGDLLSTISVSATGGAFDLPVASKAGTYTAVLKPNGTTTGMSASFTLVRGITGALEKDGAMVVFAGEVGQNGRYSFFGEAGERLGLGVTSIITVPASQSVSIEVRKPDGTQLVNCTSYTTPGNCNLPVLPMTGMYAVTVNQTGMATASVGLLLSRTVENPIIADGAAVTFSTARVGQDGRFNFTAAANTNLTLVATGVTFPNYASVQVVRPDGSSALSRTAYLNDSVAWDFTTSTAGTYSITVDPLAANTGQLSLRLVQEASGSAGSIDGTATTVSLGVGQNGRYTFNGDAGDRLGLGLTSITTVPASQPVSIDVRKPDGTQLVNCSSYTAPGNCNLPVLPVTGTYAITVNQTGMATASVGLLLSRTVENTLIVDGTAVTFSTARVGQDGRFSFTAAANTNLTLVATGGTFPNYATVQVLRPDGGSIIGRTAYPNDSVTWDFTTTTAGTYSITVDPLAANTGQLSLRLVQEASGGAGSIDGTATAVSLGVGQNGRYTFNADAGDRLGLGVTSITTVPASQPVTIEVRKPDGTQLVNCSSYTAPGNCNLPVLPVTGTYAITVNQTGMATASVGLLLSRTVEDTLIVDGTAVTFSTARVGQDGRFSFTAAANTNLTLVATGGTFPNYASVQVLRPDGNSVIGRTAYPSDSYTWDFTTTTAGTYSITVDPQAANTGQLTLRLVQETSGSAGSIDGTATTVSLGVGQNGRYTFSGDAGDRLGLGLASITTVPASQPVTIDVRKPDGTQLVNCSSYTAPGNCNLPVLPVTGTYAITVNQTGIATASVGLLLSRTVENALIVDGTAVTFSTARVGQDGRFSFTAAANTNLTLVATGGTFPNYAALQIIRPDGVVLTSRTAYPNQSYTWDFTTTTAGTYSITVDPQAANTGQLTLRMKTQGAPLAPASVEVKR